LLVKLQEFTKLRQPRTIQVYVPPFWLCFLDFIPVGRVGISHMNRQQCKIRPGNQASPATELKSNRFYLPLEPGPWFCCFLQVKQRQVNAKELYSVECYVRYAKWRYIYDKIQHSVSQS